MGLSVNQDDSASAHDSALCVSTDGKPCDIDVLRGAGRRGGSLRSETHSAR